MDACCRFTIALLCCAMTGCTTSTDVTTAPLMQAGGTQTHPPALLVYTRTTGYRHDSISTAIATLRELARSEGMRIEATEDPRMFDSARLARYRAVIFANTTGDVLDEQQREAFEAYVRAGGGFMGIHSAADSEYTSAWYGQLVGARFAHHPPGLQTADVHFESGQSWRVTDEFYDFDRNPRPQVHVIATLDERDYAGGRMGEDHPIAWCHDRFGGRAWYTGLGHDAALYADATYRAHLLRGLRHVTDLDDAC